MISARINNVLAKLKKVKKNGQGWQALCPAHEDENPSLSIDEGDDGRVLLYCHAGCSFDSIVQSLGMSAQDLMPQNGHSANGKFNKMKSSKIYDYKDESGKLLYQILKYENPKHFSARQPDGMREDAVDGDDHGDVIVELISPDPPEQIERIRPVR